MHGPLTKGDAPQALVPPELLKLDQLQEGRGELVQMLRHWD